VPTHPVPPTPALELEALTKRYDDGLLALDAVDLVVPAGEFFGLLGPNGAGKTTLISAVCNLIRTTSGEARVFGHDHQSLGARRLIGLAEQDINLDRFLDVEETLVYHGGYYGMSRSDARRRAGEMMDVFDLRGKATTRAPKLSGGMRRRLLIARALLHQPRLLLLDEPTVGLDPQVRQDLWALIDRLRSEGVSILMSTHYIEEAERLCDSVTIMSHGTAVATGAPRELVAEHAGAEAVEVYGPPEKLAEIEREARAHGLKTRRTGTSVSVLGANGNAPEGERRPTNLEDVFVLLTGEDIE
jgi:ABC-type multidrug transport system ATPase subunit